MEIVVGLIVLIVIVVAVAGSGSSATPRPAPPLPAPRPRAATAASPHRPVPLRSAAEIAHQREVERERIADDAFFDGIVFGHYFLDDPYGAGDTDDARGAGFDEGLNDELDEDYDDGMYD